MGTKNDRMIWGEYVTDLFEENHQNKSGHIVLQKEKNK